MGKGQGEGKNPRPYRTKTHESKGNKTLNQEHTSTFSLKEKVLKNKN